MGNNCCATNKYDQPNPETLDPEKDITKEFAAADTEEDSESDDDDYVDDIPEVPKNYRTGHRTSVSAEAYGTYNVKKAFNAPVHHKDEQTKGRIREALKNTFMFAALDESDREKVIDAFEQYPCPPDKLVITQGDEEADCLYFIESGTLNVYKKKAGESDLGAHVYTYSQPGEFFGELALLYNCPRAATVKAVGACKLWTINRETFNSLVKDAAMKKRERYEDFLSSVEILQHLDAYERSKIADALKSKTFKKGDYIIRQGDAGHEFYIIETGSAIAMKNGEEVMQYSSRNYFGELALITEETRKADVKVTSETVDVLVLERISFKRLLGPLQKILKTRAQTAYK